jgi:hypothetical protein
MEASGLKPMSGQPTIDAGPTGAFCLCRVASIAIVVTAWGALALLIWNLDRGFDLTDEAMLLYFYRHPDDFLDRLYLQHFRLVSALTPSAFDHIIYYRLLKLLALVGFTALFASLLVKWLGRRFRFITVFSIHPIVLFHFLLIGSFLAYCHGSQTLSYNDLVTFCLLAVAAACFALDLAPSGVNAFSWRLIVSLPIGAIIALLIPIKWSSAPLLAAYYVVFAGLFSSDRSARALVTSFGGAASGSAFTLFVTSDVGIGTMFSFAKLFGVLSDRDILETHPVSGLLKMYAGDAVRRLGLVQAHDVAVLVLPVAAMVVSAFSDGSRRWRLALRALVVAALLCFVVFLVRLPEWALQHQRWFHRYIIADLQTFAFFIAWFGACCCIVTVRNVVPRREAMILLAVALLLAGLPVAGSIGTNNPLLTQFIRHMAPLFAALAITAAFLGFAGRWRPFAPIVCAAIALLSAAQLAFVVLLYPYRLQQPGLSQTIELAAPRHMAGLKVDAPTSAFIHKLLSEAHRAVGNTTTTPILALFDMPGAVYILDGKSIGHPWHSASSSEKIVCDRIQSDPQSRPAPRLILLDRDTISASLAQCLREGAIDVARYEEVARIQSFDMSQGRPLRLLVPKTSSR